jgi:LVIVD repeat
MSKRAAQQCCHCQSRLGVAVTSDRCGWFSGWRRADSSVLRRTPSPVILDISDPTRPSFLGRTEFAPHEEGNAHSAWLGKHEDLLIQTDEDFDPAPSDGIEQSWGYPRIFDISDPANPV